jgi:hypothetical protein
VGWIGIFIFIGCCDIRLAIEKLKLLNIHRI